MKKDKQKIETQVKQGAINPNTLPSDMIDEDRQFIIGLVNKYASKKEAPSKEDILKAMELISKYNVKINTNPRPILSRFARKIWDSRTPFVNKAKQRSKRDLHRIAVANS